MAAARAGIVDGSGDGEDLAAGHPGQPRGDQRPGSLRRFDDQRAQAQARDDAIALRKVRAQAAAVPGGNSEISAPAAAMRSASAWFSGG